MARGLTSDGRRVVGRRNGVVAIRPAGRWRRALVPAAEGAFALVPLVLVLAFVLPPPLLLVPPLLLCAAAWLPFRRPAPAGPRLPAHARVTALRSARARRRGSAPRP